MSSSTFSAFRTETEARAARATDPRTAEYLRSLPGRVILAAAERAADAAICGDIGRAGYGQVYQRGDDVLVRASDRELDVSVERACRPIFA